MLGIFRRREPGLLDELKPAYGLEWVESDVTMINTSAAPSWWRGHVSGERFGIRDFGRAWEVYVGRIPPLVDLELSRVGMRGTRAIDEVRLEDHLPPGHPLAMKFVVSMIAHDDERFHGPQLAEGRIAQDLSAFDEAVWQIALYRWGVELKVDPTRWTRTAFDSDLSRAAGVAKALAGYAGRHAPPGKR